MLVLPLLTWLLVSGGRGNTTAFSPEKVNLALRRTADQLLRASGDSTSRIPAIEQFGGSVWRIKLEQSFQYEQLPALLQASLDNFGINRPYSVAIRRCEDAVIDLGYQQMDFQKNGQVPCGGRDMPEGCHFIEVTFSQQPPFFLSDPGRIFALVALALILGVYAGYRFFRSGSQDTGADPDNSGADYLHFGNSRLDAPGQILLCNGVRETLTFREAKLLRLFAARPGQLLERDFILQEVWANEGILVGRSIDMFVSRLRKKLANDPAVAIVAVHGVGYRMEVNG